MLDIRLTAMIRKPKFCESQKILDKNDRSNCSSCLHIAECKKGINKIVK